MNNNIGIIEPIKPKTFDFHVQFKRCEEWNDPDQWDALGMLYYQRGYDLNALHCFRRADACRAVVATETEREP